MNIHGYIELAWLDNVLFVEAFGPFNEEGINVAASEYTNTVKNRKSSSFSIIEIWDSESLGSPEVMNKVAQDWQFFIENNCTSIAIVVSNKLQQSICEKLLTSKGKVFMQKEEAIAWTQAQQH